MPEEEKTVAKKDAKKNNGLIIGICVAVVAVIALVVVDIILINAMKDSIVGSYVLTSMVGENGEEDTSAVEFMKALGMTITLEVKEDHTAVMEAYGSKTDLTWDDKTIKGKDEEGVEQSMDYTYKDGKLTFEKDGQKMIFTKKDQVKDDGGESSNVDLQSILGGDETEE